LYGRAHYLREPAWQAQVEAVLAEADALAVQEYFLTPTDAAGLLGVAVRTVTKWIRQGKLPATVLEASESLETRYHINPDDVEALLNEIDERMTVAEASAELGVEVYTFYRAAQSGRINVIRDDHRRIFLRKSELENAREALRGPKELRGRSMLLVEAARELRMTYAAAAQLKKKGALRADSSAPRGAVYVSRESVAAEVARRTQRATLDAADPTDVIGLEASIELSGLSRTEILQLTQVGLLKRRSTKAFLIDKSSLEAWMKGDGRPEFVEVVNQ
jgi:excisionase family DNA binding protein